MKTGDFKGWCLGVAPTAQLIRKEYFVKSHIPHAISVRHKADVVIPTIEVVVTVGVQAVAKPDR